MHSNHVVPTETSYSASCFRKFTLSFVPSGALVQCNDQKDRAQMCTCESTKLIELSTLELSSDASKEPLPDPEESFKSTDLNGDNQHCQNEIIQVMMAARGFEKHPKKGIFVETVVLDGFSHADTNQDGVVTLKEFLENGLGQTKEDFVAADIDGDGRHTIEEQITAESAAKIAKAFVAAKQQASQYLKRADQNGDGCISHQEYTKIL